MKKYRIDTQDFILYLDAKSISDVIHILSSKYGDRFVSLLTSIIEM